jgi:HlyD family secretion protein
MFPFALNFRPFNICGTLSYRRGDFLRLLRIAIALFLIGSLACRSGKKDEQYRIEKVDRGDVTMTVTATGTLSAVITVLVGSQVSGVISRLYADFNSPVKKGQLLAELDPTPFQAQVEQRRADLTKAQVDAAQTKINFDRQSRLLKAGLAPQADYDTAKAQYDGARAQVAQALAALSQAETNLKYTRILSPIDGVVVDRQYDVGQTVAASFQAPTLFAIAQDLTKMQVQADVDQSDIGRVQVGQQARFTVDAYPDEEFRGRISQIRLNATVSQNVVTYPVIIAVPNPDEKLRPKMTANVTIDVAMVHDVLRIANAALRFKPDVATTATPAQRAAQTQTAGQGGGPSPERAMAQMGRKGPGLTGAGGAFQARSRPARMQTVWILGPDKKPAAVQIRTGITDGHYTQVVDGNLKPGDSIIVGLATSKVEGPPPPGSSNPMRPGGPGGGRGR